MVGKFTEKYPGVQDWRKMHDWYRQRKNSMRDVGKASSSGSKNKDQRIKQVVRYYLSKARALQDKLERSKNDLQTGDITDVLLHLLGTI